MNAYTWAAGSRIKTDANIAGQVCEGLAAENRLTAKNLLDVSRPEDAPLHKEFEWDDGKAAEKYREAQAGHIICCLVKTPERGDLQPVRAFCTVTPRYYEATELILKQEDKRDVLLRQAFAEMQSFRKRYEGLSQVAEVIKSMDVLLAKEAV